MEDDKMNGLQGEKKMEEKPPAQYEDDAIDLGRYWAILRSNLLKIALFSLAIGIATLLLMFLMPNIYQATAVITPERDDNKQNSTLGALASFGMDIGGGVGSKDLEMLFNSKDLTVRVFRKYNLWPIIAPDQLDPVSGKKKVSWVGSLLGGVKEPKPPGDWDAIRAAKASYRVVMDRKSGVVTISFEARSAEGAANIVKYYLEEGKSRLQEEALDRAMKNKKFIEEQIGKTIDALNRDRLYALYGQEVEREMMARNREQFGFHVVDAPRVPDRKNRPHRATVSAAVTMLAFLVISMIFLARRVPDWSDKRKIQEHPEHSSDLKGI